MTSSKAKDNKQKGKEGEKTGDDAKTKNGASLFNADTGVWNNIPTTTTTTWKAAAQKKKCPKKKYVIKKNGSVHMNCI